MTVRSRLAPAFVVALLLPALAGAQEVVLNASHPTGVYAAGEKVQWTVELKNPGGLKGDAARFTIKKGGFTPLKEGTLDLSKGPATVEASLDEPGTLLAEVKLKTGQKDDKGRERELRGLGGAVVEPTKIPVSAPPPADFDAFWDAKLKQLAEVPMNAKVEAADAGKPDVEYFKVQLDNINSSHVYGQLARPRKAGKFPALLVVQWAGVYGLPKSNVVNRAAQGWLALNTMAHDLPFDQPEEFYKKALATTHKDYLSIGIDDREKSYFLRMYLGCYRAADFLAKHPDWDGKTLAVIGTSQGGQQSLVTAGIHPQVTAMLANVPAGCDVTGNRAGRAIGFPYWANYAKWKSLDAAGGDKVVEVGRYYDAGNFAARIKCPILVSMGLIDETCPPAGVLAACNSTRGPKEILILPKSDHHGRGNAQKAFFERSEAWLRDLSQGKPAPVKAH